MAVGLPSSGLCRAHEAWEGESRGRVGSNPWRQHSRGNISVGEHVLYPNPMASEQEHVMPWPPSRCPGRGVRNLAGVGQAGSYPPALCEEQIRDKEISEHSDVFSVQVAWEPALAAVPGR